MNYAEFIVDDIRINSRRTLDRQNDLLRSYVVQVLEGKWSEGELTDNLITDSYVLTYFYPIFVPIPYPDPSQPEIGDLIIDTTGDFGRNGKYSICATPLAIVPGKNGGKAFVELTPEFIKNKAIFRPINRRNIEQRLFVPVDTLPILAQASQNQIYIMDDGSTWYIENGAWRSFGGAAANAYGDGITITGQGTTSSPFKVNPSAAADNALQIKSDGVYVQKTSDVQTDGITITGDGTSTNKVAAILSSRTGNVLQTDNSGTYVGLYVPETQVTSIDAGEI